MSQPEAQQPHALDVGVGRDDLPDVVLL